MGETLKSGRERILRLNPLDAIWDPKCQIPCIVIYPEEMTGSKLELLLKPLTDVLSEKGFKVNAVSEESSQSGDLENVARDCALGLLILSGPGPGLQYSYGYLNGKGKFVLTIRDLVGETREEQGTSPEPSGENQSDQLATNSSLNALNEIWVDSSSVGTSSEMPAHKIRDEFESFIPAVLESYISELTKTYSSLGPEPYSNLRELAQEISNYYTNTQEHEISDLDKSCDLLAQWEKSSGRSTPFQILAMLAALYAKKADDDNDSEKNECYNKAAQIYESISSDDMDTALSSCFKVRQGEMLLLSLLDSEDKDNIEKALKLFKEGYLIVRIKIILKRPLSYLKRGSIILVKIRTL